MGQVAIYGLCESVDPAAIRYVGQAVKPDIRLKMHVGRSMDGCQQKREWIERTLRAGHYICCTVIEWVHPDLADLAERYWINEMVRRGHLLTNDQTHYNLTAEYMPGTTFEPIPIEPDYIVTYKPHWLRQKEKGKWTAADWARYRKMQRSSWAGVRL